MVPDTHTLSAHTWMKFIYYFQSLSFLGRWGFFVCFKWLCDDFFWEDFSKGDTWRQCNFHVSECVLIACLMDCERGLMVLLDTDCLNNVINREFNREFNTDFLKVSNWILFQKIFIKNSN